MLVKTHVLQNDLMFTKEKHTWCLTGELDQWREKQQGERPHLKQDEVQCQCCYLTTKHAIVYVHICKYKHTHTIHKTLNIALSDIILRILNKLYPLTLMTT